jgi:hypothetical protein
MSSDPHSWIGTETVKTRYSNFEFKNGYPTAEAADKLWLLPTRQLSRRQPRRQTWSPQPVRRIN